MIEAISEPKADRILNDMKTIKKGVCALQNTEDFIGENGTRPMKVQMGKEVLESTIDWELYSMMEAGVFHAYLQLYLDGFRELGNQSMIESGVPQVVNTDRLLEIDREFKL